MIPFNQASEFAGAMPGQEVGTVYPTDPQTTIIDSDHFPFRQ